MLTVKFGNLSRPKHTNNPEYPDAEIKVKEMMDKLHDAGFSRQENISDGLQGDKFYHIFELPYQIEFSGNTNEAIEIMRPYENYLQPLMVTGLDENISKEVEES